MCIGLVLAWSDLACVLAFRAKWHTIAQRHRGIKDSLRARTDGPFSLESGSLRAIGILSFDIIQCYDAGEATAHEPFFSFSTFPNRHTLHRGRPAGRVRDTRAV